MYEPVLLNQHINMNECSMINTENNSIDFLKFNSPYEIKSLDNKPFILLDIQFLTKVDISHISVSSKGSPECRPDVMNIYAGENYNNIKGKIKNASDDKIYKDINKASKTEIIYFDKDYENNEFDIGANKLKNIDKISILLSNDKASNIIINSFKIYGQRHDYVNNLKYNNNTCNRNGG